MRNSARLGPAERAQAWRRFGREPFDVLVIGGGVTGAGTALDAVTRGLRTALVEARDFASGTSSRSSKLFHGGLRYLEQLNFELVAEALQERDLMLSRLAPHLVRPVPFVYPLRHRFWERPYVGAGLILYDTMARRRTTPMHRHLTRGSALKLCPALRRDSLVGAIRYYDAQVDDARHTLTVVRTAARYGAVVRNSSEVTGFLREGGRIVGAHVRDVDSGATTTIRAKVVINCTGVWTDDVQRLTGGRGRFRVRASKGVHILVPRDRIPSEVGLILRTEQSVLFVIPWGNHWIVGTTDTDWNLDKAHPAASRADIDYLLAHVNDVLVEKLTPDDIEGVYAGLRPLLAGESEQTSQLSREHAVARPLPGLVSIAGGKYTTYRVMAKDAVDAARADLDPSVPDSVTENVPLLGAEGYHALANQVETLADEYGLPVWRMQRLLGRYGSLIDEVLELAEHDRTLLEPLPGAGEYLAVEARYAATHEAAVHLDDVLARRTRISIETAHRGTETAAAAAGCVADVLGWDEDRVRTEVEIYKARVAAERESQRKPDDLSADAERLLAPDTRELAVGRALL
ncbi:glycerol-3-phosphate dehydrogenase/oxidase [Thermasporomyces composti]|uniref:Glycerol-3-phosphate dehydrogenase n=1 Tax=Thermasporomyces composti TaxID=696763 RepID=A0A3D9V7T4_THECX|nr:glycerol-3-phosphate dehydrogenase/oxidase [Thermasporomyces composti]REF35095.1 glycerol-3-phosphate dehydrogenase [Thermasporomyces composti]